MTTYEKGEKIPIFVNSLTSAETLLPLDYYKLGFCQPATIKSENVGEYLTASRIQNSPYDLKFMENQACVVLCERTYQEKDIKYFESAIKDAYRINWILDNLPVISESWEGLPVMGFELGSFNPDFEFVPQLNNHIKITIAYNSEVGTGSSDKGRIVDFMVIPYSFEYSTKNYNADKNRMHACEHSPELRRPMYLSSNKTRELHAFWTYSVEWREDNQKERRTRWDNYFQAGSGGSEMHRFSIIIPLLIVLILSGMVGITHMRSLHYDSTRYSPVRTGQERAEGCGEERKESGWKLVHADVFRPPSKNPMFFCVMIGTGNQLLGMALSTLLFAIVGVLRPSNRGELMVASVVCFVLLGIMAGYTSSRTYKMFKGKRWQACTILTATLLPGILFVLFLFLNLFAWGAGSDAALPIGSILLVFFRWTCISVPSVIAGAFFGYRKPAITFPVETSNIPRPIPPQSWYMTNAAAAAAGGVLPFGVILVELYFELAAIWTDDYYYGFGFPGLSLMILIQTCAEITIVVTYFQLCAEDYNWYRWWRSFFVSAGCSVYVFLYSAYFFWTRLGVTTVIGTMFYFGYMAVISGALALLLGAVGVAASLWFTRKIYASIKVA
ncbi:hypothetical protein Poli38472_011153 [Pythium oligandrum]|uniref:Transmembrane 9 superfamily member n=1 Tax=Pythium oligandrum TaxID=41045 RepID=A0A8K1CRA1_PYTOL|nr:hypothetical protein Poli38472_011153 [Pythium oligandrum]|eukprot:TMW67533.1 hypothetical protein Poli38472_011153 [Pythium oligandrum]